MTDHWGTDVAPLSTIAVVVRCIKIEIKNAKYRLLSLKISIQVWCCTMLSGVFVIENTVYYISLLMSVMTR